MKYFPHVLSIESQKINSNKKKSYKKGSYAACAQWERERLGRGDTSTQNTPWKKYTNLLSNRRKPLYITSKNPPPPFTQPAIQLYVSINKYCPAGVSRVTTPRKHTWSVACPGHVRDLSEIIATAFFFFAVLGNFLAFSSYFLPPPPPRDK